MSAKFNQLVTKMPELLNGLKSQPFLTRDNLANTPKQGVYVFYENDKAMYVGRSNRLKARIRRHSNPSSHHNSAHFAFRLADEERSRQNILKGIKRKDLEKDSRFHSLFSKAKDRVRQMKIRVIPINDQIEQALFEIYAHLALKTKYNDFSTH